LEGGPWASNLDGKTEQDAKARKRTSLRVLNLVGAITARGRFEMSTVMVLRRLTVPNIHTFRWKTLVAAQSNYDTIPLAAPATIGG
jgi:hypothetical protein